MAVVLMPIDLFLTQVAEDEQVSLGSTFTGWAAKRLTVPHLAIRAAGAYGAMTVMITNERERGAVVVTGPIAGAQSLPLHGVYGATKAVDRSFGEMLWAELRNWIAANLSRVLPRSITPLASGAVMAEWTPPERQ